VLDVKFKIKDSEIEYPVEKIVDRKLVNDHFENSVYLEGFQDEPYDIL
jgi:hypothetical protein